MSPRIPAVPEVEAVTKRLDAIPPQLITPEFRAAVIEYAKAASQQRRRIEAIQLAAANVEAAVSAGNFEAAGAANALRHGIEQLQLPPAGLPQAVITEPLRLARQLVLQAESDMGKVPAVRYLEQLEAWRAGEQRELPPALTPADKEAVDFAKGMALLRKPIVDAIASWHAYQNTDPVAHIEAAVGIRALVDEYIPKHQILAAKVEAANQSRMEVSTR